MDVSHHHSQEGLCQGGRNRPWEERANCTHLLNGCFPGLFHFIAYCVLNYPEGKRQGGRGGLRWTSAQIRKLPDLQTPLVL